MTVWNNAGSSAHLHSLAFTFTFILLLWSLLLFSLLFLLLLFYWVISPPTSIPLLLLLSAPNEIGLFTTWDLGPNFGHHPPTQMTFETKYFDLANKQVHLLYCHHQRYHLVHHLESKTGVSVLWQKFLMTVSWSTSWCKRLHWEIRQRNNSENMSMHLLHEIHILLSIIITIIIWWSSFQKLWALRKNNLCQQQLALLETYLKYWIWQMIKS